jgi:cation transport ATPase
LEGALTRLGFRTIASPTIAAARKFKLRAFIITTLELLVVASAGAHAGLYPAGGFFHSPLTVMMLSAVVLFGVGWPFYNFAFDAGIQDEYDVGVLIALLASTFAIASLPFGMISPTAWLTSAGFVVASTLTAGWFILRATQILGLVHSAVNKQDAPPAPQTQLGVTPNGSRD